METVDCRKFKVMKYVKISISLSFQTFLHPIFYLFIYFFFFKQLAEKLFGANNHKKTTIWIEARISNRLLNAGEQKYIYISFGIKWFFKYILEEYKQKYEKLYWQIFFSYDMKLFWVLKKPQKKPLNSVGTVYCIRVLFLWWKFVHLYF